jgi:O-antigen ligase
VIEQYVIRQNSIRAVNLQRLFQKIEEVFVVISLLYFTRGLAAFLPGTVLSLLRYGIPLCALSILFLLGISRTLRTLRADIFLCLLTFLAAISFLWSAYPQFTLLFNRSELMPMSIFGVYLAVRFTLRQQVKLIAFSLAASILLSYLVVLVAPGIGIGSKNGLVQGIFSHKNDASAHGILAALSALALSLGEKQERLKGVLLFCLALLFVLLTTSKTGLVLIFLIPTSVLLYLRYRWKGRSTIVILCVTSIFAVVTFGLITRNWDVLLEIIGGNTTLTGRTYIWEVTTKYITQRPFLGYGRTAFWVPGSSTYIEASKAVSPLGFTAPHAHNGYIDMVLDVGFIGAILFGISFIKTWIRSLKLAYRAWLPEQLWPLGFLMFLTINNMTESYLLWNTNLYSNPI